MMLHYPIASADLDDIVAWLPNGARRLRDLLAEARALAARLPQGGYLLNVCEDRWHFSVGFVAGLLNGMVSLQPSSQSAETLHRLAATYPDLICLTDGHFDSHGLPGIEFPESLPADPEAIDELPDFPADRLAAILFTSGSTGLPQAHAKTWGRLVANGRAGATALGIAGRPHVLVGTVPIQHSYGFESTFLLALHGGCAFWSGKPFYPQDIITALEATPRPRLLVTTPFHLSTLLASGLELPPVDLLLSATAPLSDELARQAEARCHAPLLEIYGSTESGQVASRRTSDGATWHLFPDVVFEQDGDSTYARGGHVEGRVELADRIELSAPGRFLLLGRQADVINIAGKRTSLAYLNHQIAAIPGVVDGAFFLPSEKADGVTRLCAFVVAPTLSREQLLGELRQRIDAVFLPRPVIFLDRLPRNSTGKLPQATLATLFAERGQGGH